MDTITNPEIKEYALSLNMVDWKANYVLSKASIGQIMVCFSNILKVIPKNVYEIKLYEKLKPAIEKLLSEFNKMLMYKEVKDRDVKFYNLIVNMPNNVSINDVEAGSIVLKSAKIGALIKAMKQRINFIKDREFPQRYLEDQELLQEFHNLRMVINNYLNAVNDFESEFISAIDGAHKAQQMSINETNFNRI
jgi:hypothetical protein